MKSAIKKSLAVILAVLMVFSASAVCYAQDNYDFSVTPLVSKHYLGVSYTFTASITNVPEQYLVEKTETSQSAFEWSASESATAVSLNNYTVSDNGDGTYTVSEEANVTMPAPKSDIKNVRVTAKYLNANIGSATSDSVELYEPIAEINATSDASSDVDSKLEEGEVPTKNNPDYNYYYQSSTASGTDSFYFDVADLKMNQIKSAYEAIKTGEASGDKIFGHIFYSAVPELGINNPDDVVLSLDNYDESYNFCVSDGKGTIYVSSVNNKNTTPFTITLLPQSGYRTEKKINAYPCIPAIRYLLLDSSGNVVSSTDEPGGLSAYTNQEITLKSKMDPEWSNDSLVFELYDINGNPCDPNWCTTTPNGECKLNIKSAGTYILHSYTVSYGRCLYRNLPLDTMITISEISNIANIDLYEKNSDGTLDSSKPLTELTINRSGNSSDVNIYDLSQNVLYTDKDGNRPAGDYVDYKSSDTSVATIDSKGVITALKRGKITITVSSHNSPTISKDITLNVIQLADSIRLESPILELPQGHTIPIKAILNPVDVDEDISWSSMSAAVSVDDKGNITANPDYDLSKVNGSEDVVIKATTSISNKTAEITIKVIPANPATAVNIAADTLSSQYSGFYEDESGNKYAYKQDKFTLSATALDEAGNASSDVLTWRVRYENYENLVDFSNDQYRGVYYSYTYDTASDTYTITPEIRGSYTFYCIAVQRGYENDEINLDTISDYVYSTVNINVVDKVTKLSAARVSLPTNSSKDVPITITGSDEYDPLTFTSDLPLVADVTYNTLTKNATIIAKASANVDYQPIIHAVSRSGASLTISVRVANDINEAVINYIFDESDEINSIDDYVYDGKAKTPKFTLSFAGKLLSTSDYSYTYKNNVNAGEAEIVVVGKGDFENSQKSFTFNIKPRQMIFDGDDKNITISGIPSATASVNITESNPAPTPTVTVRDTVRSVNLKAGDKNDYTVTAINNTKAGVATAIIEGSQNYTGRYEFEYNVCDNISNNELVEVVMPSVQKYTGSEIKPEIKVYYDGELLKAKSDNSNEAYNYTVKFTNNTYMGTASVAITGVKPFFTGTYTTEFEIVPQLVESFDDVESVEINAVSSKNYGFNNKDGVPTSYTADPFTVSATGYDSNGKIANCDYTWYFSCDSGETDIIEIPEAAKNNITASTQFKASNGTVYFSYTYNYNSQTFTITPNTKLTDQYKFTFYCVASTNGNSVQSSQSIIVFPKPVMSFKASGTTTIPTGGQLYASISYDSSAGYEYCDVEFTSSDITKATVEKDENFDRNHTVIIKANPDEETRKTGPVTISATSWDGQVKTIAVTIKFNIDDALVTDGVDNIYDYTGAAVKPIPELVYSTATYDRTLVSGTDYKISSYTQNTNSGNASIVITGIGEFTGTKTINFTIARKNIAGSDITTKDTKDYYQINDRNPKPTPTLTIKDMSRGANGTTLRLGTDYTITCKNNDVSGYGTATVNGIGNYTGSYNISYKLCDDISKGSVKTISSQTYNGKEKKPAVTVTYKGKTVDPKNYTVSYSNNVRVGTATVTITGTSPFFYGKLTKTFSIIPPKTSISKLTAKKAQLTVKWSKKTTEVTGYQIQYSTSSKFTAKTTKSVKITKNTTTSKTIKKLKSKKKYYVRVRTYKTVNGKNCYSKWSAVKNIKVK